MTFSCCILTIGQFVLLRYDKCSPLKSVCSKRKKSVQKRVENTGKAKRCRNPRNSYILLTKSEASRASILKPQRTPNCANSA